MTIAKDTKIWRQDITGLRALAVLPVLIYHAFPSLIPGGFLGVDIFFVISGYLISGIIFRGIVQGNFSFQDFYIKRIKRIIPNLILVLAFVLTLGWFVTTSKEYLEIAANVRHSAFFYQNLSLMKETDYFGMAANLNPLLHIWSLSIEEQFYLLFPVLTILVWRLTKHFQHALGYFVALLTFSSLVGFLCISDSTVRFYFPLTRFWELGAGICLAYAEIFCKFDIRNHSSKSAHWLSGFGFVLVIGSMMLHGIWPIAAPRLENVIPVLGTVLIIIGNTDAIINRSVLSWKWMVFVGAISYSLYLWHWPLLVYLRVIWAKPETWQILLTLLMSFPVSFLVYRYVENPIRRFKGGGSKHWTCSIALLLCLVTIFSCGKVIRSQDGFPNREVDQILYFLNDWSHPGDLQLVKVLGIEIRATTSAVPEILFIGDSHAEQYSSRAVKLASLTGKSVGFLTAGGCMASIGKKYEGETNVCKDLPRKIRSLISNSSVKTLVITQKWGAYGHRGLPVLDEGINAYNRLVESFVNADRKVFVLLDQPWDEDSGKFDVLTYVENRFKLKEFFDINQTINVPLPSDQEWKYGNECVLHGWKAPGKFISTADFVCPNGKCDLMKYRDNDHLRSSYVRDHAVWIDQVFE